MFILRFLKCRHVIAFVIGGAFLLLALNGVSNWLFYGFPAYLPFVAVSVGGQLDTMLTAVANVGYASVVLLGLITTVDFFKNGCRTVTA